jgi:hypothetical protein
VENGWEEDPELDRPEWESIDDTPVYVILAGHMSMVLPTLPARNITTDTMEKIRSSRKLLEC